MVRGPLRARGTSFLKHALSADVLFMIGAAFPVIPWVISSRYKWVLCFWYWSTGLTPGVRCLCSLASRVRDAALALALAQTVLCTIIFNGTAPIPPATAVNYVPWAMLGFMYVGAALSRSLRRAVSSTRSGNAIPVGGQTTIVGGLFFAKATARGV